MIYDEGFVQEVRANPLDEEPRLIFADYLEEVGHPLAEFIRTQIGIENCVDNEQRCALDTREKELLQEYGDEWLEPLRRLGAEGVSQRCFRRGLVERVRISAEAFLANGHELCQISPALHVIQLLNPKDVLDKLVEFTFPQQVTSLDLSSTQLRTARARPATQTTARGRRVRVADTPLEPDTSVCGSLFTAKWFSQLRELNLQFNNLQDDDILSLLNCDLTILEHLWLGVNKLGARSAIALGRCPTLTNLKTLSLRMNQVGGVGVSGLADFSTLGSLEVLDLSANQLTYSDAQTLSQSQTLPKLRKLILRANSIKQDGIKVLKASPAMTNVEIDLRGN